MKISEINDALLECAEKEGLPFSINGCGLTVDCEQVDQDSIYNPVVLSVSWSREWNSFVLHMGHK